MHAKQAKISELLQKALKDTEHGLEFYKSEIMPLLWNYRSLSEEIVWKEIQDFYQRDASPQYIDALFDRLALLIDRERRRKKR